jgi:hypothetical protein
MSLFRCSPFCTSFPAFVATFILLLLRCTPAKKRVATQTGCTGDNSKAVHGRMPEKPRVFVPRFKRLIRN